MDKDGGTFSLSASGNNLVLDYSPAATVPVIDTPVVTDITTSSATLGATLQANGNATVTDYGVVWGTSATPTTGDNKVQKSITEPAMPSVYTVSATSLTGPQTLIYYRGYAINFPPGFNNSKASSSASCCPQHSKTTSAPLGATLANSSTILISSILPTQSTPASLAISRRGTIRSVIN